MSEYRIERDSMGELKVPARCALWGAQTQRAVENFPISGLIMPREFIRALGLIKSAAAQANADLGHLKKTHAKAIRRAAERVAAGEFDAQFPIDVFQTGSGTSSNMNANEVIAHVATTRRHEGASERRRQQRAVVERCDPDRDPGQRCADRQRKTAAGAGASAEDVGRARARAQARGQDRPHASDGRDAGDARAGARRLVGADAFEHRTPRATR